jgi:hypothetical protein
MVIRLGEIIFGFVRAIESRDPSHIAPPFVVELYSPTAKPGERTKRFHLEEVCDNRELVLVSVLRDALIHSLPVKIGYNRDNKLIDSVEVRTRTSYEEWEKENITGKIKMISVDEFGIGEGNTINPNLATIVLWSNYDAKLFLNLQRAERETKLAQLSMLQQAYKDEADVTLRYENMPVGGGKTVRVIIGVQLGVTTEISPDTLFPDRIRPR